MDRIRKETIENLALETGARLEYKSSHVYIHREGKPTLSARGFKHAYMKLYAIRRNIRNRKKARA